MAKKASTTKTSKKTAPLKKVSAARRNVKSVSEQQPTSSKKFPFTFTIRRTWLIFGCVAIVIVGLLYYYRGLFVVASVNGVPISRVSVIQELEKRGGKQMLNQLVTKALIVQEAKKQNIAISREEINQEIKKLGENLSKRGQNIDQLLAAQGMAKTDLVEEIRIQKLVEKILAKEIQVSDKEIAEYMDKNKETLSQGTDSAVLGESVKKQLEQEKLSEKFQAWMDSLQKKAKINYFVAY